MRKNRASDKGFILAYIINFLFCSGWAAAALFFYLIHHFWGIPELFWQVSLAIWFIYPLITTTVLTVLIRGSEDTPKPSAENKNPYSNSTESYINKIKKQ